MEIISEVCGRRVTYNAISEREMLEAIRKERMPEGAIQYIMMLFDLVSKGLLAEVTDTVREVTGRAAISSKNSP